MTETTLPKAAEDLLTLATEHGWRTLVQHFTDSGGSPYVDVQIGRKDGDRAWHYTLCWHTRDTGTYRLFSKIARTSERQYWHDAPSLKAIRSTITSTA